MENSTNHYRPFQKKIMPYLDGSLSAEETSEFEAFVVTHPEFESQIKFKQDEIALIRSLIPTMLMSREAEISLEKEVKTSVYNLLKVEPRTLMEKIKRSCEDWLSR